MGYHACFKQESAKKEGNMINLINHAKEVVLRHELFLKNNTINQSSSISNDPCKSNQSMIGLYN